MSDCEFVAVKKFVQKFFGADSFTAFGDEGVLVVFVGHSHGDQKSFLATLNPKESGEVNLRRLLEEKMAADTWTPPPFFEETDNAST